MTALPYRYEGDGAFQAMAGFRKRADAQFVVGEAYTMEQVEQRSGATHRHYFATLHDCWQSLPDDLVEHFPNSEVFRKKLLIKAGYCDERSIVCASKAEAQRVAAFIKPMDDYAIVTVRDAVVRVFTAQSQSTKAMGKKVFAESKDKVLSMAADLVGVTMRELENHSEAA